MKQHKRHRIGRFLALALLVSLLVTLVPGRSQAANSSSLKSKLADIESQQKEVSSKIASLKKKKNAALEQKEYYDEQIELLDEEIGVYEEIIAECDADITSLNEDVTALTNRIEDLNREILLKEDEHDDIYQTFKSRIRVMYEEKLTTYAGFLLLSGNISDFLNRIEAVRKILSADSDTLQEIEGIAQDIKDAQSEMEVSRSKIESDKAAIEEKKAEQEENKSVLASKRAALSKKQEEAEDCLSNVIASLSSNQKLLSKLETQEANVENEIKAAAKKEAEEAAKKAKESAKASQTAKTATTGKTDTAEKTSGSSNSSALSWPLPGISKISCYYGYRTHPVTGKKNSFHTGIDIPASSGTAIKCSAAGTVTKVCYNSAYGNMIVVSHSNGLSTMYAHMKSKALYKVGDTVSRGTTLGYVGTTGLSTGNHLHFSVLVNGEYVDPTKYVSP